MGVSSALYSGVSGLMANSNAMSVIGNNIANSNTIGFKSSRTIFGDILAGNVAGSAGSSQVGRGVNLSTVDNIFSQGTFSNTESNSDLAIEGPGFFIVSDPVSGSSSRSYTRAGAFRFNDDGFLVNPEGYNVLGFNLNDDGDTTGDLTPIWADTQSFISAHASENVTVNTNLDSDAVVGPAFDPLDPNGTSNYATSIQAYDSLGTTHLMTTYFTKTGPQAWAWNTVVDGGEIGGTVDTLTVVGSGTLNYDASGDLISMSDAAGGPYELYSTPGDTSSDPVVPRPTVSTTAGTLLWNNGAVQNQQISIDGRFTRAVWLCDWNLSEAESGQRWLLDR